MTTTPDFLPRTWIDIDLDALVFNYKTACSLTRGITTAVIKANAYGHGAVRVAEALYEAGCRHFAVACAREALELRRSGIQGEILVMGLTEAAILPECIQADITLAVGSTRGMTEAEEAAAALGSSVSVHLKTDSGFHRLGFVCNDENAELLAKLLPALTHVQVKGIFTHLGLVTQEADIAQNDRFVRFCSQLKERGITLPEMHICDSIGMVRYPDWQYERVRAGAFLFGVRPYRTDHMPFECRETLTLRTTVARVHTAQPGDYVGYDDSAPVEQPVRVATLCAGYGDGYMRCLSRGRGKVLIRGKLAPVMGVICMDQMMVDVTNIPDCEEGDVATLVGGGVPYMDVADWANTNRNEMLTMMSRRPQRVYHQNGRIVTVIDSMLNERRDAE